MTAELIPANPHTLKPGDVIYFRNAGTAQPTPCKVETRGPLNQFRVTFIDPTTGLELPYGHVAVNEHRELWWKG
jgi:hypothetical protein